MTIEKFQKCFSGRLIPRPISLECTGTELLPLKINTPLILTVHSDLYDEAAELVEKLAWKFWKWQVLVQWSQPDDSAMIPEEGYGLTVNKDAVAIRAFDLKGIRYAMNTLRQI